MELIEIARNDDKDFLDSYIEAQVHGLIKISRDIEALVLDPSYKGTDVESLASQLTCGIEWHDGYALDVGQLVKHADYRGTEIVEAGKRLAIDGILTPKIIGDAAANGDFDEQSLKKVWHCVARFGKR